MSDAQLDTGGGSVQTAWTTTVLMPLAAGFLFAVVQFSYFFLLEVHLSSRAVSFFVALCFWLCGFLGGLNLRRPGLLPHLLVLCVASYYLALLGVRWWPYDTRMLAGVGVLIAVSGLAPGYFFPSARALFPRVKFLFLHENNGFVIGILAAMLCAVFAGKWLLALAPGLSLLPLLWLWRRIATASAGGGANAGASPVTAAAQSTTVSPSRESASPDQEATAPGSVLPFFLCGLHFAMLQVALFFLAEVYVTATYAVYFAVVLAWLCGVLLAVGGRWPYSLRSSLAVSLAAYYVLAVLLSVLSPYSWLQPLYLLLAIATALPAGALFRCFAGSVSARCLFLHENNGFVIGYLAAIFCFVKWGVNLLYLGPLVSGLVAVASLGRSRFQAWLPLPVLAFALLAMGEACGGLTLLGATLLGALACWLQPTPPRPEARQGRAPSASPLRARFMLLLAGASLVLLQLLVVRELSSILAASEVSILLVATAYFAGFSVGYAVCRWLRVSWLRLFGWAAFCVHLGLLLGGKVLAGYMIHAGYGGWSLLLLVFVAVFCCASFFSILLPRLIEQEPGLDLAVGYAWDLAGAVGGTVAVLLLVSLAPALLLPIYFALLLLLLWLLAGDCWWRRGALLLGLGVLALLWRCQAGVQTLATEDYYRSRGYSRPRLVFAGHSFYHAVELLDTRDAAGRTSARHSFLNGVPYFQFRYRGGQPGSETDLSEFTYYLAGLPAKYLASKRKRKLRVLILGGGSLYSLRRVRPHALQATLVEIDPLVVRSSRLFWGEINRLRLSVSERIVIDDAKRYLRDVGGQYDLIINDISAPYYLETVLLHCREFYGLVYAHLQEDGIFAESTQGNPKPWLPASQGMRILRGVADVFPYFRVVSVHGRPGGGRGFVYACKRPLLATAGLTAIMRADGMYRGTSTYWEGSSRLRLHRARPFALTNMETILSGNLWRLRSRLGLRRRSRRPLREVLGTMLSTSDPMRSRLCERVRRELTGPGRWGWTLLVLAAASLLLALADRRRARRAG